MATKNKKRRNSVNLEKSASTDVVTLDDQRQVLDVVQSSVLSLWDAVNNLTRLRPTKRERYRVTIFGSARIAREHPGYAIVRDLAAELSLMDCDIITGGGPGLMQAANEGAHRAMRGKKSGKRSMGIRITLPFEQDVNAFVTEAFEHRTFFTRLHHFVLLSDAFVVVPGGIGTVLELMMVWQLLQVRKMGDTPLILAGRMYEGLVEWCRQSMLRSGSELASPEDMQIPVCVSDAPSVMKVIRTHHAAWRSRQGGGGASARRSASGRRGARGQ